MSRRSWLGNSLERVSRGLVLLGLVGLLVGGVALLPSATPQPIDTSLGTLLEPLVATTVRSRSEPLVGVLTNQTFPLTQVPGLDGFSAAVGPVELRGRHWLIASRASPGDRVTVLSSEDGWEWQPEAEIVAPAGKALRIDHLAVARDQLVAAGSIGEIVGRPYWQHFPSSLTAWTSADGQSWTTETLADNSVSADHWVHQVVANESTTLVTGNSWPTPDLSVIETVLQAIPPEFEPALIRGDLWFWPQADELQIVAPPGLVVFKTPLPLDPSWDQWSDQDGFLYRRVVGGWVEGEPPLVSRDRGVARIAVLPSGGFVSTNQTLRAVTSLGGANWQPEASLPVAHEFLNWGTRLVAKAWFGSYQIDDGAGFVKVEPPEVMLGAEGELEVVGVPAGLVSHSVTFENAPTQQVVSGEYTLWDQGGRSLSVTGSGFSTRVYVPRDPLTPHVYDPISELVTLEVLGETFDLPLADLRELSEWPPSEHSIFVSIDGVNWSSAAREVTSDWVQILGGGSDLFLVASWQGGAMSVYRAGPFD